MGARPWVWLCLASGAVGALTDASSTMTLVETIPLRGMDELTLTPGAVHTWEAQAKLASGATFSLDVSFMYENLLAESDVKSSAYFSESLEDLGAARGRAVFEALTRAVDRGVRVRILGGGGIGGGTANSTLVRRLVAKRPDLVRYAEWDPSGWYGGGIMHMKLWVADGRSTYVGSANMDWASLAQVKEFGVLVDDPGVGRDATRLFDAFWAMATADADAVVAFDPRVAHDRTVPRWSSLVDAEARAADPLAAFATPWNLSRPMAVGGASCFVAASPPEVVGRLGRLDDEANLVATIDGAQETLSLAVMDFLPASAYAQADAGVVFAWPALSDALARAVSARGVRARLLVSWWPNSDPAALAYLAGLQRTANSCHFQYAPCAKHASLDVKIFLLPGWDALATYPTAYAPGTNGTYPAYTRVAHGKVMISETRANIGTSNWQWGYMYETAGASFNTDDAALTATLQAAFDRDWNSSYALPLDAFLADVGAAACRGRSAEAGKDGGPSDVSHCEAVLRSLARS